MILPDLYRRIESDTKVEVSYNMYRFLPPALADFCISGEKTENLMSLLSFLAVEELPILAVGRKDTITVSDFSKKVLSKLDDDLDSAISLAYGYAFVIPFTAESSDFMRLVEKTVLDFHGIGQEDLSVSLFTDREDLIYKSISIFPFSLVSSSRNEHIKSYLESFNKDASDFLGDISEIRKFNVEFEPLSGRFLSVKVQIRFKEWISIASATKLLSGYCELLNSKNSEFNKDRLRAKFVIDSIGLSVQLSLKVRV